MSRAWWDSLTEKQRIAHSYRSSLGITTSLLRELEAGERRWGRGRASLRLLPLLGAHEHGLIEAELSIVEQGLPLALLQDVRSARARLVALRLRMAEPRTVH